MLVPFYGCDETSWLKLLLEGRVLLGLMGHWDKRL